MSTLFIPEEIIEKLHCSICNLYLSIFPIYTRNDGGNSICGRCKMPNDDYLRDEAYEGLAEFLIFPCSHAKNGCNEKLVPLKLKDHEFCCTHRKLDCPSKSISRCIWQGPSKKLRTHFEESHSNQLLTNRKFEIQFLNSTKENLLMPYEDELFVVRKEIDSRTGTFICSVQHVIKEAEPESFNYFVRMETGNSTYYHTFPERSTSPNSDEKTKCFSEFIRERLHDPTTIIACIEIKKHLKESESKVEAEIGNPDWDLLRELKCPVCLEYMLAPIYQCLNGHSICWVCKIKVASCPRDLCQSEIRNTQNFSLGRLAEILVYPCKNYKMGCRVSLRSAEIWRHQYSCEYEPYSCPLEETENCTVEYTLSELISHVEQSHGAFILKSDKVNVPIVAGETRLIEQFYIIKFQDNIFKVCFKYYYDTDYDEDNAFFWALQLIGPEEECQQFKFEIDVIDNSDRKLRHYVTGFCAPLTKNKGCFEKEGSYMCIMWLQISRLITNSLSYRIRVLRDQ